MICSKCGSVVNEDSRFCKNCGNAVDTLVGGEVRKNTENQIGKILMGIVLVALFVVVVMLVSKNSSYEEKISAYENESAIDKTVDAVESWLDIFQ